MNTQLKKLAKDQRGLSTMEYAVLFVIIVVGALGLWAKLGQSMAKQVSTGAQKFDSTLGAAQNNSEQGQGN